MLNLLIVLVFLDYISIKIINSIGILDYRIIELFSRC
jgi:hypothetical protein